MNTLQSASGCDGISTLNLTIKDLNVGDTTMLRHVTVLSGMG